jgi:hypothetical protein
MSYENKPDIVFAQGMIVKRNPEAPEWKLAALSIKVSEFKAFLDEHEKNGWVNIECLVSKSTGKPYAKLDTWEPSKKEEYDTGMAQAKQAATPAPAGGDFDQDIPFAQFDKGGY